MMEQYTAAKEQHRDALLFFRMGDFFELFFEDAEIASRVLGITLTSRDKGENPIPMAGIPHRNLDTYLQRMIRAGYKVAICDQVQDPRDAKGIVERRVTRVVTPGTLTEDAILDGKESNFLVALVVEKDRAGLARVELSTGRFVVSETPVERLADELARLGPAEVLASDDGLDKRSDIRDLVRESTDAPLTRYPDWVFGREQAYTTLLDHFAVQSLDGFGCDELELGVRAAGAALHYLRETQKTELAHLRRLDTVRDGTTMELDRGTIAALELVTPSRRSSIKSAAHTLLGVLDATETAMGARLLRGWVLAPLVDLAEIRARSEAVRELHADGERRATIRERLSGVYDIERITARVGTGRANARDLVALGSSAARLPDLASMLAPSRASELVSLRDRLDPLEDIADLVARAIADEPPVHIREGGIIRTGFHEELDEIRSIRDDGQVWLEEYRKTEAERTGIATLKIGYTKIFGYYLEVTHAHKDRVPEDYVRKQTLKNAERYITPELKEYEGKVVSAEERARDLEYELFLGVRSAIGEHIDRLQRVAIALAEFDALASLAEVAAKNRYVFPDLDDSRDLAILDGRHPVLDVTQTHEEFIPNDTILEAERRRFLLITGPNMAGKSTFIRTAALLVLMAQIGSGVPARAARVGVVDRIFTRVGASDELTRGKSTFMVEMDETALILNKATERSLIVLDEVGRGTSTFDGVSIAWAISEYVHNRIGARTLFATHYHQLTDLAEIYPGIVNCHARVHEAGDDVVFLRKIVEGGTDKSYGIHVAQLAGVPRDVVDRAREILDELEEEAGELNRKLRELAGGDAIKKPRTMQLSLFRPITDPAVDVIRNTDPDAIDSETALATLRRLRELVR